MAKRSAPESMRIEVATTRRMQVIGPILAERLLRARNSQLPGNWQAAMRQILPFPVEGMPDPAFAASLLVGDELRVGPDDNGFSLFFLAMPNAQAGYDTVYARYADYTAGGKLASRAIDFLDWNRDGSVELLLENYGADRAWFSAIGRRPEGWRRIYDGRCGAGSALVRGPAPVSGDTIKGSASPGGG